jgi:hypothetical protein
LPLALDRTEVAFKRLRRVLRNHKVACARTLEQKISDAGPAPQRVDPHILTMARSLLSQSGEIRSVRRLNVPWFYLDQTPEDEWKSRLDAMEEVYRKTQRHTLNIMLGQVLEIAILKALRSQSTLEFFGDYPDLDTHDDSQPYTKEEPPGSLSGRRIPGTKKLDFLIQHPDAGYAGIEAKNIREWLYPDRVEVRELLLKCCALDVVPVLIARRIHYSLFSVLNPCGVIIHQTFNQLYPSASSDLAAELKDKTLLGYHDIRTGNEPDKRLNCFIHNHLPKLLPKARASFEAYKDLLQGYGDGNLSYKSFAARVKRRLRGEPEDLPSLEPVEEVFDFGFE